MVTVFPVVHLNGTSKDALAEQLRNAMDALLHAMAALADCHPNGRDYYPLGDGAIGKASREHAERVCKVEEVREELQQILEKVLA